MKQTKLSTAGVVSGILLTVGAGARYFVLFPDTDKGIAACLFGILWIAFWWSHGSRICADERIKNRISKLELTLTAVEQWIVDKDSEENEENLIEVEEPGELEEGDIEEELRRARQTLQRVLKKKREMGDE